MNKPVIPRLPAGKNAAEQLIKYDAFKELGSPVLSKRKIAMEQVRADNGADTAMILTGMLDPEQNMDEFTRIGVVRALALCPGLPKVSETLAWCAVKDPSLEVRREACATIKKLNDVFAEGKIVTASGNTDKAVRDRGVEALREIDDPAIFVAILMAYNAFTAKVAQNPDLATQLASSLGAPNPVKTTQYSVWKGVRLFPQGNLALPFITEKKNGEIISIGMPDVMRELPGKDVEWYSFENWLREKLGEWTSKERADYLESSRGKMRKPE